MKYSVIDVSSSSISMIVAENGGVNEVVSRERASLSLIHYLEGDSLSRRGIVKLAALLNHMKALAAAQGAERCYVISTAALRHVANSGEIAAFVRETTGLVGEMLRHVRRESGENDLLLGRVAHLEASLGLLARLPLLLRHQATTSPVCPYRLREAP